MSDNIHLRIKEILEHYNMNKNSFSVRIGIQPQTLHHIIDGRKTKPGYEIIRKILLAFEEINSDWLILNKGEMLKVISIKNNNGNFIVGNNNSNSRNSNNVNSNNSNDNKNELEQSKKENEMLKELIKSKDEIIELLKSKEK